MPAISIKQPPAVNGKRKADNEGEKLESAQPSKRSRSVISTRVGAQSGDREHEAQHADVQRRFYPPEMSIQRARQYIAGERERPIETLEKAIKETQGERDKIEVKDSVVHWFKMDIRTKDNYALHLASEKAKSRDVPLICVYLCSPQDWEAHITSAVRVDFVLRTLEVLKQDLAALDIPLYVETVEKRKKLPARLIELCQEWGSNHIYCNAEYEVDELRREARLTKDCAAQGVSFTTVHDTCVVEPGKLAGGGGQQLSIYSPWFRKWCAYLKSHPQALEEFPAPARNPPDTRSKYEHLFDCPIPSAPPNKTLTPDEKTRFRSLWPAGEASAHARLAKFSSSRLSTYSSTRNFPAQNSTSVLSVHLASGTLSARTCVCVAQSANTTPALDGGLESIRSWIAELAWRDFHRHVLAHWPHVCMGIPFKTEYANIRWERDDAGFAAWCAGRTGYPLVDAAMRQLNFTGWMHNRCRMVVASFLTKDLLVDWRRGERYFMEKLVDGDFASNNGGWGWCSGSGVDPQPYVRIFNPLVQGRRFDGEGVFVRKWVEELRGVEGGKVHELNDGRERGQGQGQGYPRRIVEHGEARERALRRYKEGLGRGSV